MALSTILSTRSTLISQAHLPLTAQSDEALVQQAKAGKYEAFEVLYERHRNLVYRFVYGMVQRRDDAEDITQDTFVKAYGNLANYRDEAKFTTWMLKIASNLCTDQARMSQRRTNLEQREATSGLDWMTIGNTVDPVEDLEENRRAVVLRKAIMALPEHHRQMIVMRDLEEREYIDIAEVLGCTVGGAKLRVLRARRALRDRVQGLLTD